MNMFRVGFGFDVHQLDNGIDFWLGGVKVEHHKGAVGHSDADVVLHAICDALLGAAALGDIGVHFPDTSNEFKGIDSKILLQRSVKLIAEKGYAVGNVDVTLALQAPKIKPYIPAMIQAIAPILGVNEDAVSIKATTTEKLGYVGNEQGVNAYAVALIYKA
jgi:2-C-methyl-D-erythritol 2,4-cyclodiphosphate synthase